MCLSVWVTTAKKNNSFETSRREGTGVLCTTTYREAGTGRRDRRSNTRRRTCTTTRRCSNTRRRQIRNCKDGHVQSRRQKTFFFQVFCFVNTYSQKVFCSLLSTFSLIDVNCFNFFLVRGFLCISGVFFLPEVTIHEKIR